LKKHENESFVKKVDEFISNDIVADLQKIYNINYKAPVVNYSHIEDESIDCVTSTATLEHVVKKDIYNILNEAYRIIKKDGIVSFMIDYVDHYSYSDKDLPLFNFYKYSEKSWKKYNPYSHYQNRIRHNDYLKIFSESGFEVLNEIKIMCSEKDMNEIKKMKIDKKFEDYSISDLSVKSAFIFLRKKS
jgi:ubiquinone/menaquinone biosynthesis C-methylase UbiE